jgi:uncharacterized protein (DUF433 family)
MTHHDFIVRDPSICGGQPVIRGTRVLLRVILGHLAHGETTEAIRREFPSLSDEAVRAVISFAAASASEDLPAPTGTRDPLLTPCLRGWPARSS